MHIDDDIQTLSLILNIPQNTVKLVFDNPNRAKNVPLEILEFILHVKNSNYDMDIPIITKIINLLTKSNLPSNSRISIAVGYYDMSYPHSILCWFDLGRECRLAMRLQHYMNFLSENAFFGTDTKFKKEEIVKYIIAPNSNKTFNNTMASILIQLPADLIDCDLITTTINTYYTKKRDDNFMNVLYFVAGIFNKPIEDEEPNTYFLDYRAGSIISNLIHTDSA